VCDHVRNGAAATSTSPWFFVNGLRGLDTDLNHASPPTFFPEFKGFPQKPRGSVESGRPSDGINDRSCVFNPLPVMYATVTSFF